jgi:hypothetical protein
VLLVLRKKSAQTMEDLTTLAGMGWEQVFFSVDQLSRSEKVSLASVRPCEYRILIGQMTR